jgi:beta-glucosidase
MIHSHEFPKSFIWGTATAAHQVEGNNTNSDWWKWEKDNVPKGWPKEESGMADDSYNRYEEDFDLCKQLNNNAVRISIEWARIEPKEGSFDQEALDHYKKMLKAAQDRGLKTFVTLHHFTSPLWLAKKGGWTNLKTPKLFAHYAAKCEQEFGTLIDTYMTINEPQVLIMMGYIKGVWPPNKHNPFLGALAEINMQRAHNKAYKAIKKLRNVEVGLVKNIVWYETHPHKKNFLDELACSFINYLGRDFYIRPQRKNTDFIGLNYYFTFQVRKLKLHTPQQYRSDMGWWVNPKGLENILVYLKKYDVPIYITENGLADADDNLRGQFLRGHLIACSRAIEKGANLKGYFHWSLLDNFEWSEGYWPKFGLVEIDRENNLERKPRMSFYYYADVCKNNAVEH